MTRTALARKLEILDPVALDPRHYTVEFENDSVRVVRIKYGPREKSIMHDHGDGMAIFLTDLKSRFTYQDGSSEEITARAGDVKWMSAFRHLPENLSDSPMELIYVEIKG